LIIFLASPFCPAPVLAVLDWKREGYEMIKSADRQYVLLNGFGHLDILVGEYVKNQVFTVLYNWLQARK